MLNNPERLAAIVEHSELIASVAECSADVEHNQLLKRQKKDKEEADKKKKEKGRDPSCPYCQCFEICKQG